MLVFFVTTAVLEVHCQKSLSLLKILSYLMNKILIFVKKNPISFKKKEFCR